MMRNRKQEIYLETRLHELEKGLNKAIESCIDMMKREMHKQIFEKYPELIDEAIKLAPDTAHRWGGSKDEGGVFWATYKAIVRRDGVYQSPDAGFRDFNAELMDPITKRLATSWERAFQNRLPKVIELYTQDSSKILHHFHEKVEERARQKGVDLPHLALLKNQIHTYEHLFNNLLDQLTASMTELQRGANRNFTPAIITIMGTAYSTCTTEQGRGSFKRMKTCMNNHVDHFRHYMFQEATETVKRHLNQMCRQLQRDMEVKSDEIVAAVRYSYTNVLGGATVSQSAATSNEEGTMRVEIKKLLLGVDDQFRALANGMIEQEVAEETNDNGEAIVKSEIVVDDEEALLENHTGEDLEFTMGEEEEEEEKEEE